MSEKFNSGRGALICDGCSTMLTEGKRLDGSWERVIRPVMLTISDPAGGARHFCRPRCAHGYCQRRSTRPTTQAAICAALLAHYQILTKGT